MNKIKVKRDLSCVTCGKTIKVGGYEGQAPYTCSVCRGVVTPKKPKAIKVYHKPGELFVRPDGH